MDNGHARSGVRRHPLIARPGDPSRALPARAGKGHRVLLEDGVDIISPARLNSWTLDRCGKKDFRKCAKNFFCENPERGLSINIIENANWRMDQKH
jgi:hypothetical protein